MRSSSWVATSQGVRRSGDALAGSATRRDRRRMKKAVPPPIAKTATTARTSTASGRSQKGVDRSAGGRRSFNSSSWDAKTELTVSRMGTGETCATVPSWPRTETARSGVSNIPGANSVTLNCFATVLMPSSTETVCTDVCAWTSQGPHSRSSLGITTVKSSG